MNRMPLGDGVLLLAMLIWLSVGVGPWWLGVVLFFGAMIVNFFWFRAQR